jgi:hypothetical protein
MFDDLENIGYLKVGKKIVEPKKDIDALQINL